MQHYDFIIAGGGCAGLSLAYQLLHSPLRDRSILIIDRDDKDQNDRTWAFWTDRPTPFQPVVHREWDLLRIVTDDGEQYLPTAPWRYLMIRGDDWYRHIRELLATHSNVTWLKAPVKRIEDRADGAVVWFDPDAHGPEPVTACHGGWVFDSMFNIHTLQSAPGTRHLLQHFKGWFIETPDDRFDLSAATIFDFRTPQDGELRFFYLLPTSTRSALVEYVGLSLVDYDALLDEYIRSVLGVPEYTVVSDEIGITPMTDYVFPRAAGRHVMRTGIQGGLAKPTTGYAYTRIQEDSAAIVASLCERGHPFAVPPTSEPMYRWLDSVMLQVMRDDPHCLKETFLRMFSRNPGPRIFRFLEERASLGDALSLILTLPKLPFVLGAGRVAVSRARGLRGPSRFSASRLAAATHQRRNRRAASQISVLRNLCYTRFDCVSKHPEHPFETTRTFPDPHFSCFMPVADRLRAGDHALYARPDGHSDGACGGHDHRCDDPAHVHARALHSGADRHTYCHAHAGDLPHRIG